MYEGSSPSSIKKIACCKYAESEIINVYREYLALVTPEAALARDVLAEFKNSRKTDIKGKF